MTFFFLQEDYDVTCYIASWFTVNDNSLGTNFLWNLGYLNIDNFAGNFSCVLANNWQFSPQET